MKKICIFVLLSIFCITLIGCEKNYGPNKFAAPEGFFMYFGNSKSFTDGSNTQPLVTAIEYDDEIHDDIKFVPYDDAYIYFGDDAFFNFHIAEYKTVFLQYNIKDKTQKILYSEDYTSDYSYFKPLIMLKNLIVLRINKTVFAIDYQGNVIEEIDTDEGHHSFIENYIVSVDGNDITYREWGKPPIKITSNSSGTPMHDIGASLFYDGLIIQTVEHRPLNNSYGGYYLIDKLYVYDISTSSLKYIDNNSSGCGLYISDGCYLVYEKVLKSYENRNNTGVITNCVLYKLDNQLNSTKIYTFDSDKDFTECYGIYDNNINFSAQWIDGDDYRYQKYTLNLAKNSFKKGTYTPKKTNPIDDATVCGDYKFYIKTESERVAWISIRGSTHVYHYYLYRYNVKTKKEEVMQYRKSSNIIWNTIRDY